LGIWKNIFERGVREHRAKGGAVLENPARHVKRLGVRPKKLTLPEPDEFIALVRTVATGGSGFSAPCAELIQFLAYSGCRLSEAGRFTWGDIDWNRNELVIHSAKQRRSDDRQSVRRVPIIPPMKLLLESLKSDRKDESASAKVCRVRECQRSLNSACSKLKIARITHHDLRHLFATRCIESGVDIPTVARWLGHKDGGALAMKTYGHLRNEHSQAMAAKVRF
jgi:integrase